MCIRDRRVADAGGAEGAVGILHGVADGHLVHMAKRDAQIDVLVVLARHLAGLAPRAARAVKVECLLRHDISPFLRLVALRLGHLADVAVLGVALSQRRRTMRRQRVDAAAPVSYTHLDVYKRQTPCRATPPARPSARPPTTPV